MTKNKTVKVGDKIVKFSKVYKVIKIENRKSEEKQEKIILFIPYFAAKYKKALVFSIPEENLDKASIRWPITKKELKELLLKLKKKPEEKIPLSINEAKEVLHKNDPENNVAILKRLWAEKHKKSANFSKSKQDILAIALERLVEEIALVSGCSLIKAQEKIQTALEKKN
ncbi:hypothetical protein ACFLZ1_00215 [Patescibacteria group bacterium]